MSSLLPILLLITSLASAAPKEVDVWSYYTTPPFITAEGEGLSHEFIALLNRTSADSYHFNLRLIPRTRIDRHLQEGSAGAVLFVHWSWMGDQDRSRYLWSPAILSDRNEVASRMQGQGPTQIHFDGASSLAGLTFGGALGRKYKGLEPAFADGTITRRDTRREEQNLDMLLHGRIDVTSAAATVLRYHVHAKGLEDDIFFSPTPLFSYTRHLLVTPAIKEVMPLLTRFIESLPHNPDWQQTMQRYAVQ